MISALSLMLGKPRRTCIDGQEDTIHVAGSRRREVEGGITDVLRLSEGFHGNAAQDIGFAPSPSFNKKFSIHQLLFLLLTNDFWCKSTTLFLHFFHAVHDDDALVVGTYTLTR